jgi:thymidylate kinase
MYGRFIPIFTKPIWIIMKQILNQRGHSTKEYYKRRQRATRSRFAFMAYCLAILTDYLPQIFCKVVFYKLLGYRVIVADRYVVDTLLTDVMVHDQLRLASSSTARTNLFPRSDVNFLIDIPVRVSMQRKTDTFYPFLLERLIQLYRLFAQTSTNTVRLDGTCSSKEIERAIHNAVMRRLHAIT